MARKRRVYEDDDGRTIADMSGISRPSMFGVQAPGSDSSSGNKPKQESGSFFHEEDKTPFTPAEQRLYALAALKAALLIGLAFAVGIGVAILIMLWAWGVL
jgi:hypothetical protein